MKYPEDFINKIVCGDNLDLCKLIPNDTIDMCLCSPPYSDIRSYKGYTFDFPNLAKEITRILKPGGSMIWVVGDKTQKGSETLTPFRQAIYFKDVCGLNIDTLIYKKDGISWPHKNVYHNCFEFMFLVSKRNPKTFNGIKDKKNSQAGKTKKGRWERLKEGEVKFRNESYTVGEFGLRNNIWEYGVGYMKSTTDKIAFKHSAIFPDKLAYDCIYTWSNPGDLVLDPFSGSGTTCKQAKILGRNFIGLEISPEYVDISNQRLSLV
jgi:site-specific DNA-methyltransferase (adenine-specific)